MSVSTFQNVLLKSNGEDRHARGQESWFCRLTADHNMGTLGRRDRVSNSANGRWADRAFSEGESKDSSLDVHYNFDFYPVTGPVFRKLTWRRGYANLSMEILAQAERV